MLRDYPNSRFFRGLDIAISAAGYNTYHELLYFGIPSIFIPREGANESEDQLARARLALDARAAEVVRATGIRNRFQTDLAAAVNRICDPMVRKEMSKAARDLITQTGNEKAAQILVKMRGTGSDRTPSLATPKVKSITDLRNRYAEDAEIDLLDILIEPGKTAIDVGGYIGLYTAKMVDCGANVKVLECRPDAAKQLRSLFSDAPVEVIEMAASDTNGEGQIHVPYRDNSTFGARASLVADGNKGFDLVKYAVHCTTLDALGINDVCLLKIDVEGHEGAVIRGAREMLIRQKPNLVVEIEERHHPNQSAALIAEIEEFGYSSWVIHRSQLMSASNFDFNKYQDPTKAKTPTGVRHPDYLNNFVFLSHDHENELLSRIRKRLMPQSPL